MQERCHSATLWLQELLPGVLRPCWEADRAGLDPISLSNEAPLRRGSIALLSQLLHKRPFLALGPQSGDGSH